jgi:hypothetical protein
MSTAYPWQRHYRLTTTRLQRYVYNQQLLSTMHVRTTLDTTSLNASQSIALTSFISPQRPHQHSVNCTFTEGKQENE